MLIQQRQSLTSTDRTRKFREKKLQAAGVSRVQKRRAKRLDGAEPSAAQGSPAPEGSEMQCEGLPGPQLLATSEGDSIAAPRMSGVVRTACAPKRATSARLPLDRCGANRAVPRAVEEWCRLRYAVLLGLSHAELLHTFLRRHELAMALVARSIAAPAADGSVPRRHGRRAAEPRSSAVAERRSVGPTRVGTAFSVRVGESFEEWLQRLCRELPPLQRIPANTPRLTATGDVQLALPKRPASVPRRLRPLTDRVAYVAGMDYAEFTALLGTQLLLSAGALGTQAQFAKGSVTLASARKRAAKKGAGAGISKALLAHTLLVAEVRAPAACSPWYMQVECSFLLRSLDHLRGDVGTRPSTRCVPNNQHDSRAGAQHRAASRSGGHWHSAGGRRAGDPEGGGQRRRNNRA